MYNFLLLVFFLISASYYKDLLILDRLQKHNVDYAYVSPFMYSIKIAAEDYQFYSHAAFYKNEKLYLWSYSELAFYICPESAKKNISIPSYKLYRKDNKYEEAQSFTTSGK